MEDVCASVTYPDSFDITVRATTDRGSRTSEALVEYRRNAHANHTIARREAGRNPVWKKTVFYRNAADGPEGTSASDTLDLSKDIVETTYLREFSDAGEWGDWNIRNVQEIPSLGAVASSVASGQSGTEEGISSFCGLPLEIEGHDVEFRHVGEETVNGIRTNHYYHSYSPIGWDNYISKEFWIDSSGLFVQVKEVAYIPPTGGQGGERVEKLKTYSGWGEPNVITVPVLTSTPEPTPALTPEPPPTPEPTATPEPTPTPEPTQEPTATPESTPTATPRPEVCIEDLGNIYRTVTRQPQPPAPCLSVHRPGGDSFFYSFTLSSRLSLVRISLDYPRSHYLLLLRGAGTGGGVAAESGGADGSGARISVNLSSGTYTLEAGAFPQPGSAGGPLNISITVHPTQ